MSLDLKGVTLLVTELAPVPALIQRLGRLNRQATAKDADPPVYRYRARKRLAVRGTGVRRREGMDERTRRRAALSRVLERSVGRI